MSIVSRKAQYNSAIGNTGADYLLLQQKLLRICVLNFFILSLIGLLLRAYPIFDVPYFSYKNVLHGHSHFAFGGWLMPILAFLILRSFPETCTSETYRHWRNSVVLMLVSSYGMLLSFPFQGYGLVSIVFSTLSLLSGFYMGAIIRSSGQHRSHLSSWSFLLAGFFYFFISSLGPFATGPLIAMGKAGTPVYYNAIYFFLHFQYNGFFTFVILALLYRMIERNKPFNNSKIVFRLLNFACIPAFFLSVLWTKPPVVFYIVGGAAAVLQLVAVLFLLKDLKGIGWRNDMKGWLFRISIFALIVKSVLQVLSSFPEVATMAYQNRNFIIAYLHLVLIGFISVFVFAAILKITSPSRLMHKGIALVLFAFISTELLLVLHTGGYLHFLSTRSYLQLLFGLSVLFPVGLVLMCSARLHLERETERGKHSDSRSRSVSRPVFH